MEAKEPSRTDSRKDSQRDILEAIRRILRALRISSRAAESDLGLSGAQLLVLQILASAESLSINELAERTRTHQSSVSTVVSRLADRGFVKRSPSPEDARRVEVSIKPAGLRLVEKAPVLAQEKLFEAIAGLSPAKQKSLAVLLNEVVENAGFAEGPASMFFEDEKDGKSER